MVEHVLRERLRPLVGHIRAQPLCVQAGFVHAHKSDGGEVVVEGAEVALGVGIQALLHQLGDDRALGLQAAGGKVHHLVQPLVEVGFVFGQIRDARHIDRHHADRAGAFAAAEEPAALFAQLAQVETQPAAHAADVRGLHIAVDVVGEIRRAVFRRHLEQQAVVFGLGPVEVLRDRIGRDRVLEAASVRVALDHRLDEGFVDHRHFLDAVLVFEIHLLAADDRGQFGEVVRNRPVERDVRERRLRAPARRRVHAENEGFDALFDFAVGKVVGLDEGRQIGVERRERLRARPFVLHNAEEVDHLVAERGQMRGRRRRDLARNAAQPLLNELFERPARAVARQHA